jgi:transposase
VTGAYAVAVRAQVAILGVLNEQIELLQGQVEAHFGQHPDAEIYTSQPGLGQILGARVLAEFGDDPTRYADAKARKNYAGTSPITKQSGKKKVVAALRQLANRLVGILHGCLKSSTSYDEATAWSHHARQDQQAAA